MCLYGWLLLKKETDSLLKGGLPMCFGGCGYGYGYRGYGYGHTFVLIVVLFILLIIVGTALY